MRTLLLLALAVGVDGRRVTLRPDPSQGTVGRHAKGALRSKWNICLLQGLACPILELAVQVRAVCKRNADLGHVFSPPTP
jgi:hypothetical protein